MIVAVSAWFPKHTLVQLIVPVAFVTVPLPENVEIVRVRPGVIGVVEFDETLVPAPVVAVTEKA